MEEEKRQRERKSWRKREEGRNGIKGLPLRSVSLQTSQGGWQEDGSATSPLPTVSELSRLATGAQWEGRRHTEKERGSRAGERERERAAAGSDPSDQTNEAHG